MKNPSKQYAPNGAGKATEQAPAPTSDDAAPIVAKDQAGADPKVSEPEVVAEVTPAVAVKAPPATDSGEPTNPPLQASKRDEPEAKPEEALS